MSPRRADRCGERKVEARDDVCREFAADRRLDRTRVEPPRPRMAGVTDDCGVHGVEEQRPGTDAALRSRQRKAIVDVDQRDMTAREAVGAEAAQYADRPAAEVDR